MSTFGLGISAAVHGHRAIRRYAVSLTRELVRLDPESEFRLFAWRFPRSLPGGLPPASRRVRYCPSRIPGRLLMPLWNRGLPPAIEAFTGRVDLFHTTDQDIPTARRALRAFTLHGLIPYMVPELLPAEAVRTGQAEVDRAAATCDLFLAVSGDTRRNFVELFPRHADRVFVTPLGIDPGFSPEAGPRDDELVTSLGVRTPFILSVGAVSRRKNIGVLLNAQRILDRDDLQVVLAGGVAWPDPELDALLQEAQGSGRALVTGWIDPDGEALRALYRKAAAVVHPSLCEGWTSPPLEAMASGTPVVASRASSLPETVGDAGRLFDPQDPEDLAEALRQVLDDEPYRQDLIRRGLVRAAQFTWERNARLTLDAYNKVLKR